MSDRDICPRPGCDLPYSKKITDASSFSIRAETFKAWKLCVIPIHDGEKPGFIHVYHSEQDVEAAAESLSNDEDDPEVSEEPSTAADGGSAAPQSPDTGYDAPGDISPDHQAVFDLLDGHENPNGGTSMLLADLRPAAVEAGVEKSKVEAVALNLDFHGFVDEVTNGVFRVAETS